jgi:hypothetical protein
MVHRNMEGVWPSRYHDRCVWRFGVPAARGTWPVAPSGSLLQSLAALIKLLAQPIQPRRPFWARTTGARPTPSPLLLLHPHLSPVLFFPSSPPTPPPLFLLPSSSRLLVFAAWDNLFVFVVLALLFAARSLSPTSRTQSSPSLQFFFFIYPSLDLVRVYVHHPCNPC